VLRHLRYLAGGLQDEGVGPGSGGFDGPEDPIVHLDESAELGELRDHQGEVMLVPQMPDAPDALYAGAIAQSAAQRITGISRVGDQAVVSKDLDHLVESAGLRIFRMDAIVLSHAFTIALFSSRNSM
jgi:hypothetical protein